MVPRVLGSGTHPTTSPMVIVKLVGLIGEKNRINHLKEGGFNAKMKDGGTVNPKVTDKEDVKFISKAGSNQCAWEVVAELLKRVAGNLAEKSVGCTSSP
jgi:hypothetical protein